VHARRLVARDIHDREVLKKLFDTLAARFSGRPGGYIRLLRLGTRWGDGAEMSLVELVGSELKLEKKDDKKKSRKGKPAAVIVNHAEYERLKETLDVLSDRNLMGQIRRSRRFYSRGRKGASFEEIFGEELHAPKRRKR